MKTRFPAAAFVLAALTGTAAFSVHRERQPVSYCDVCVKERDVVQWRFAKRWTLLETATIQPTPVSGLLDRHQACPPHEHRWSTPQYVPEAGLETADAPRVRSLGLLNAPRSVSFLRSVFDYTDAATAARWRELAWRLDYASALEPALRFSRFPEAGFATRGEFLAWWDEASFPLFHRLNQTMQPD